MSDVASKRMTVEEYLAHEGESTQKSEYLNGETFAMGGGSALHSLIAANLARAIGNALADGPCRVFNSDMRVITASGLYTYPDVSVVCHQPVFQDAVTRDVLVNP